MKAFSGVATAATLAVLISGAFFTRPLVTRTDADHVQVETPLTPSADVRLMADEPRDAREPETTEGVTDLYGNEVSDAIATYTFDQSGSLYELHSPQTELPRLGSPKS